MLAQRKSACSHTFSFLHTLQVLKALPSQSLGVNVVKATGAMLSTRHGAERLSAAWHGGMQSLEQAGGSVGGCSVPSCAIELLPGRTASAWPLQVRTQICALLEEYSANEDMQEVVRCLADLHMGYYHHEVVKAAIELTFAQEKVRAWSAVFMNPAMWVPDMAGV